MDVSIILVNYNTKKLTQACIDSVFKNTYDVSFEIILVDNNSSDGSAEFFSKDYRIIFVESGENLGFGKANNLGLKYASGTFVFFLNTDTLLLNNAVKLFYEWSNENHALMSIGGVGCFLQNKEREYVHSYADFPNAWKNFRAIWGEHIRKILGLKSSSGVTKKNITDSFVEVDYVTGADLFVKREVLDCDGCFDPDFFMYYEESEMQFRWKKKGRRNFVIQGPEIIHLEGGSQKQISVNRLKRDLTSRLLFFKKTMPVLSYRLFRILYPSCFLHMFFSNKLTWVDKKEIFKILVK